MPRMAGHVAGLTRCAANNVAIADTPGHSSSPRLSERTSPMSSCSFNEPVLQKGDQGNAVRLLQTCLHGHSVLFGTTLVHDPGPIDGVFGPQTDDSLRSFQTNIGPGPVDGIAGPITWSQ